MLKGGVDNDDGIVSDDPLHNTDMSSLSFDAGMSLFDISCTIFSPLAESHCDYLLIFGIITCTLTMSVFVEPDNDVFTSIL